MTDQKYINQVLEGWEEVYKKGHLTLWILLSLKDGHKHMSEIKQFINSATNNSLTADDQSMYRALRRYYETELVDFETVPGNNGPDLKVYRLTSSGERVLKEFVERNIVGVFFKPSVEKLLRRK